MTTTPIPEEVVYFQCVPNEVTIENDGYKFTNAKEEKVTVRRCYVADSRNSSAMATGKSFIGNVEGTTVATKPNEEIAYVQLINTTGGYTRKHIWHVLIDDTYCVEMFDSTLLDAVRNSRAADGKLYGPFIWARTTGGLRLIRVGSRIYNDLVAHTARIKTRAVRRANLIPGNIYEAENGHLFVFIGNVDYETISDKSPHPESRYDHRTGRYTQSSPRAKAQYVVVEHRNSQVWMCCDDYKSYKYKSPYMMWEASQNSGTPYTNSHYGFELVTVKRVVRDLGKARNLPDDLLGTYHAIMMDDLRQGSDPRDVVDKNIWSYIRYSTRAAGSPEVQIPGLEHLYENIVERKPG